MRAPFVLGFVLLVFMAPLSGAAAPAACPLPDDAFATMTPLPATAAKLKRKEPVTVVALGGASTAGLAAGNGALYGYPRQLEEALKARHPGVPIAVVNDAVPHETAADMVRRFERDLGPRKPSLVLWETGTVDAVEGTDVDSFAAALQDGIAALQRNNFDVILIDMQYNPGTGSVIDFGPYLEAMHNAAELEGVSLFPRYEIMRSWSDAGVFALVDVPQPRRTGLARDVYRCLGMALAAAIDHEAH